MPKRVFFEETHLLVVSVQFSVGSTPFQILHFPLRFLGKSKYTKICIYSTILSNSRTSLSIIAVAPQTMWPFSLKAGTSMFVAYDVERFCEVMKVSSIKSSNETS